jgi:hypothetical protein
MDDHFYILIWGILRRKQNHTLRLAEKAGKVYMGAEIFP